MTDTNKEREALAAFYAWLRTYEDEVGALDDDSARLGFLAGRASLSAEAEPVAWVDERAIAWLDNSHSRNAEITTKLSKEKSVERPMPIFAAPAQAPAPGWVSVPRKATTAITCAIEGEVDSQLVASAMDPGLMHRQDGSDIWDAAIAAASAAPSSGKGG